VEWVEVAGKTVDEATDRALDQLGVAVGDAEVIVVSEPKAGLFGRMRGEARVRARVRPVGARPRRERARRSTRSGQGGRQGGQRSASSNGSAGANRGATSGRGATNESGGGRGGAGRSNGATSTRAEGTGTGTGTSRSARRRRNRRTAATAGSAAGANAALAGEADGRAVTAVGVREDEANGSAAGPTAEKAPQRSTEPKETQMAEGMTLEEQGEVGRAFVAALLDELGMEGSVECRILDEETVEIAAQGEDLGMLVGPRGSTLSALQDLTRAVVQRQCPSRTDRIMVDVAGYRERRSAALKRFSVQIAEEVLASGQEKALEAMSPADRKAVHDAINEMPGVVTRSEGEDPHRHIVIAPSD
jgi:spoIIIJ-associated protein